MTDQQRRQLQGLMEDPRWGAVEAFLQDYMMRHFATASKKMANEFDTMWYLAASEGGKDHVLRFFKEMEEEVRSI